MSVKEIKSNKKNEEYDVREHYGPLAKVYNEQYDPEKLLTNEEYPANYFRLNILLDRLKKIGVNRILDVGIGEGTPAVAFGENGMDVRGFDYTPDMVVLAKENFDKNGFNSNYVIEADIRDPKTYQEIIPGELFDSVVCAGVMPHIEDDVEVLENIRACLVKGGSAFVEFRNSLFSMFTMNRYTHEFIVNDLLIEAQGEIVEVVSEDLKSIVAMDKPSIRTTTIEGGAGYDQILSRFHNPFHMEELFKESGFIDIKLHWYHYHPAMPYLDGGKINKEDYRKAAIKLEGETSGWRGNFLCSAFVVEAKTI